MRLTTGILLLNVIALVCPPHVAAQDPDPTATPAGRTFQYQDAVGNPVERDMSEVHEDLHPPADVPQVPMVRPGTRASESFLQRMRSKLEDGRSWFPGTQPDLPSYLSGLDELGNTAAQPGALIESDPLSRGAQQVKYTLSKYGFNYLFEQLFEYSIQPTDQAGTTSAGYYAFELYGKQAIVANPGAGRATWLSSEISGGSAINQVNRRINPSSPAAAVIEPTWNLAPVNGIALNELAAQQSFAHGAVVAVAGWLDQTNYLDTNAYANSPYSQFQNSAFVNSQVLPITLAGLGLNLQWQPTPSLYGLFAVGPNNTPIGGSPWSRLSTGDMSYLFEAGYAPDDLWSLGSGAYRLQPFVASVGGVTQGGIGVNFNQQLGAKTPFGAFGRFGTGGSTVTNVNGARSQAAIGFIIQQPLHNIGLFHEANTNLFGLGFVWSKPSENLQGAAHDDEFGIESLYTFQVTATILLKPDIQAIFNAANKKDTKTSVVFQLPIVMIW